MTIRTGISGWRYPPWRGVFYPPGLPQRRELEYASSRLTHDRDQRLVLRAAEAGELPGLGRPRRPTTSCSRSRAAAFVTHMKKLRDVETPLANFFARGVLALGPKLGPLLWQLPPNLGFDATRLDDVLRRCCRAPRPRRRSWPPSTTSGSTGRALDHRPSRPAAAARAGGPPRELRGPRVRRAAARARRRRWSSPTPPGRWPVIEDVTADFVYVRLHGETELYASGYDDRRARPVGARRSARGPRAANRRARARWPGRHAGRTRARRVRLLRQRREGARPVRLDGAAPGWA